VTVVSFLYAAETAIYELATLYPISPTTQANSISDHKRIGYLMACVQSCITYVEYYLNSDLVNITMASGLVYSYSIKLLHSLSTLQDPKWDTAVVREMVNIVVLFERCAALAEEHNAELREETGEDSVFLVAAKRLRDMAPTWRINVPQEPNMSGDAALEGWNGVEAIDLPPLDFSDDFWMNVPFNP
jgi:hypothetical protein